MENQLEDFFAHHSPRIEELVSWGSEFRFQVKSYVTQALPPHKFITSVRCIVIQDNQVLLIRVPDGIHILPGGRVEMGETLDEALQRELLEETGWTVGNIHLIGVKHFHHLNPKPIEYPYPYPDFLQVVHVAQADSFNADAKEIDGYELDVQFHPISEVQAMPLRASDQMYLETALSRLEALP